MQKSLVIVVTGTSRGIGKGITNVLLQQTLDRPLVVYATSRSGANTEGEVANPNIIEYHKLDITDPASISSFFKRVRMGHGAADVLINNAAVSNDYRENPEYAAQTIRNNYVGTRDMCKAFLAQPDLRFGARIVNITSGLNGVSTYGTELQQKFRKASMIADIDDLATKYIEDTSSGPECQEAAGWGAKARSYKVSKALINTLTVVLAQQNPKVMINSCCPGWVDTEMGRQGQGRPPKTPEQGAQTAVRCAIGDLGPGGDKDGALGQDSDEVSGKFYENESIVVVGWGKSKLWLET
ncbi:hypothetical protein BDU57DRAFT_514948 [Ampelomyces quisqualis]|uniref:NAD(P)-binding protein n=1 Tax=Ampelomyces quisqualis TaxID=50730 RepID=A0A6A5QRG1_AMPQU|nr:hypothetical protein BDU57DRAFT_514948 [Ampelomyces quisqualis]